ncbi:unnamed protein product [Vicia faba]|uniref:Uncharacterized protein n=1 Tax=Vicia faba TaxID=3906 RepID=A0AAV0ZVA5_VICFA|nr:unnamed protein product [Vicia faba]
MMHYVRMYIMKKNKVAVVLRVAAGRPSLCGGGGGGATPPQGVVLISNSLKLFLPLFSKPPRKGHTLGSTTYIQQAIHTRKFMDVAWRRWRRKKPGKLQEVDSYSSIHLVSKQAKGWRSIPELQASCTSPHIALKVPPLSDTIQDEQVNTMAEE